MLRQFFPCCPAEIWVYATISGVVKQLLNTTLFDYLRKILTFSAIQLVQWKTLILTIFTRAQAVWIKGSSDT